MRTLGKRVKGNLSRVQIPHPPPDLLTLWIIEKACLEFLPSSIEIGDAHISKSLLRARGLIAVKVNAKSQCNKPIRGLVLTVEIYKEGLLFDHRVAKTEVIVKGVVIQNRVVKNQKTYVKCRSNKWTIYYGFAHAQAIVNSQSLKTLRVRSENIERFQCGN